MSNTYSLSDARAAVYTRIREVSSNLLPEVNVDRWLNDCHSTVLKERYYRFMEEQIEFNTSVDTTIGTDIEAGDVAIVLADSSGLYADGKVVINDDLISYTTNDNATTLSGCTGVGGDHDSGSTIKQVYRLSSDLTVTDFYKPIFLSLNGVEVEYYDGRGATDPDKYEITPNDEIIMPKNSEEKLAVFKYKKQVTQLTTGTDTFLIPDDYITMLIEFALSKAKGDLGYAQVDIDQHFREYLRIKRRMKSDFAKQTEGKYKRIKTIYQPDFTKN